MAGRCGSALTAQVGWMKLSGQDRALRTMKIELPAVLFPALLWSWVLLVPLLTLLGMASGWSAAWLLLLGELSDSRITARFFAHELLRHLDGATLVAVAIKTAVMAAGMAALVYSGGASPKRSATDVTRAITRGLVLCFIWAAVVDAVFSLLLRA
jgi:ABC-type transporter Mla maintaining outer membrane lipid asymmetry permease subunit MlaE